MLLLSDKEFYQKEIPTTSYDNYISGWEALNTIAPNGTTADWHALEYWGAIKQKENIKLYNNYFLGNAGIACRKINWSSDKVYIANFARAVADLVYYSDNLDELKFIFSDMLNEDEESEAFEYMKIISKHKDIDEFLKRELPKKYYMWKYGDK